VVARSEFKAFFEAEPNLKYEYKFQVKEPEFGTVAPVRLSSKERPNPSIEGMPKRLRLLVTPHVKR
jgi:hypothetical protein